MIWYDMIWYKLTNRITQLIYDIYIAYKYYDNVFHHNNSANTTNNKNNAKKQKKN